MDDTERPSLAVEIFEILNRSDSRFEARDEIVKLVEREFALGVSVGRGLEQSARRDTVEIPTDFYNFPNDGVTE
jgi:hypothetical protein